MALAVATAVGVLAIAPAFGDNDNRQGHRNNGARNDERHGDRDYDRRGRGYRTGYYHPHGYAAPVYLTAQDYYPPQPSPGVSLFFPLDIRIR